MFPDEAREHWGRSPGPRGNEEHTEDQAGQIRSDSSSVKSLIWPEGWTRGQSQGRQS